MQGQYFAVIGLGDDGADLAQDACLLLIRE